MKKLGLIILAMLLAFTVVSCKKEESNAPDGMFLVENDVVYYDLFLPEGWVVDRNDGMISAHVSDIDTSNISVTSIAVPSKYNSLPEYLDEGFKKHFEDTFPDMETIEDFTETTIGDKDAMRTVFKATVGGTVYQFEQIVAIGKNADIFVFTYTSVPDMFDKHADDVKRIVEEIKFN